jgi:hypothetical protein
VDPTNRTPGRRFNRAWATVTRYSRASKSHSTPSSKVHLHERTPSTLVGHDRPQSIMSRAEPLGAALPEGAPEKAGQKRRNLSLANITIPSLSNLSTGILKRKPLPANSPVATQRSLSLGDPKLSLPKSLNPLTPIPSPGAQLLIRDLDRYVQRTLSACH